MEESIGYEALFSSDEWHSLSFGDWDSPDPEPCDLDLYLSSGVAAIDGEGCAASSQAAPGENNSHSLGSSLDTRTATSCDKSEEQVREEREIHLEFVHEVTCRTRTLDDGPTEYVLECDICDEIGTADDYEEADVIAQQHKTFTTELIL